MTKSTLNELMKIGGQQSWKNVLIISYDLINLPVDIFRLSSLKRLVIEKGGFSYGEDNHIIGDEKTISGFAEEYTLEFGRSSLRENQIHFHPLPIEKLEKISPKIVELTKLETLQIFGSPTVLERIPSEIINLYQLEELYIPSASIKEIPPEIGSLENLQKLTLSYNKITNLPLEITKLKNLQVLDLRGNPLSIPPEILEKINEPQTILNYYFKIASYIKRDTTGETIGSDNFPASIQLSQEIAISDAKPINETKLILVGQGSVGKTSLIQQIRHSTFDLSQTKTEGITINQWKIRVGSDTRTKISLNSFLPFNSSKPLTIYDDLEIKLNI